MKPCTMFNLLLLAGWLCGSAASALVPDAADTNLWAWFDAGDSESVNGSGEDFTGDQVTNWNDRTVAGLHNLPRTSAADALFETDVINGLPVVRYPGNMDTWGDDTTAGQFLTLSNSYTLVAVARLNTLAGTGYVFDRITSRGGVGLRAVSTPTNRWEVHVGRGTPPIDMQLSSTNVALGFFQTHVVVVDGTNLQHYVDGDLVAEGGFDDGGVPLDQHGLILGADFGTTNDADCDLAEVLAYSIPLTTGQVQSLSDHYTTKYDLASQEPPPPPPSYVDVFTSGVGGYPSYRIPSLLTTINGTLLAFCEARTFAHDHAENDIVLRRSTDNGQTWLPMQLIFDNGDHSLNDPLVVQVREGPNQGRIFLFHMSFPKDCHVGCVQTGYGPDSSQNYMFISDDDGASWAGPSNVSSIVRSPISSAAGTPGQGIQMRHGPHAGRLVMTLRRWPGLEVYALYSDDGGDTWTRGKEVDESLISGSGDEVQVAELADGTLMLNSRTVSGTKYRKIAHSYDGGATWTPFQESALIEPNCDAGFIRYTDPLDAQSSRLLYAGPFSQFTRVNGKVHISYDEGETWPVRKTVYSGGYAYSKATTLTNNQIGVLFERDGYAHISFSAVTLDWLTDGADSLSEAGSPVLDNPSGATGVTYTEAELNGTLSSTGTAATALSVFWGTSDGALDASAWGQSAAVATNPPALPGAYVHSASGLTTNTLYYYRYRAENVHGTNWSPVASFSTPADPTLVPDAADPDLWAWFDAGDTNSVNGTGADSHGDAVTNWIDRTDSGLHSLLRVADGNAVFETNVINGLPAVLYPENMDTYGAAQNEHTGEFRTLPNPYSLVAVVRLNGINSIDYLFDRSTNAGGIGLRIAYDSGYQWEAVAERQSPAIETPLVSTNVLFGVFQTHILVLDGTNLLHYIDGELEASGSFDDSGSPLNQGGLILGADVGSNNDADCDFVEFLAYSIPLSTNDVQSLSAHFIGKYDLTNQVPVEPPEPPPTPPPFVDVFTNGEGGYPRYRIPALLTTLNGTLLAFCEARQGGDHSRNDIVLRRSLDMGQTWLPMQLIFDNGGDSLNDPLVVQVREGAHQGRIYLFHMSFPEGCHTGCVQPGYGPDSSQNYMFISDDDGATWTGPSNVSSIVRPVWSSAAGTPGQGIQMRRGPYAGRLVFTVRRWPGLEMYAFYSDDGGDTWIRGAEVDESQVSGGGDEVQVAELADSTLMLNTRRSGGAALRKIAYSYDGGATWTPLEDSTLIEPTCDAGFHRFTDPLDGQSSRLLYAGPFTTSGRVNGSIHISYDEAETWPVRKTIYPGGYAYSKATTLPDNRIGVLFERDGYAHISFMAVTLEWLTDGADRLSEPGSPVLDNPSGASGIMPEAALLNGTLSSTGTAETAVSVFWDTSDGALDESAWGQSAAVATNPPVLPGDYIHSARNLSTNTPYFYRYRAGNIHGTNWSAITSFATLADTDADGISDDWETLHCGSSTGCVASAQTGDNDGLTYLEEYQLDFDPAVSNAPFNIVGIKVVPPVNIEFGETSAQRSYTAEFSTNLVEGTGWRILREGIPGSNTTTTLSDPATDEQRYYRVRVP